MPKRKYTSKKRKSTFRKRRTRRRRGLPLGGFPAKNIARLRYCEFVTLDATALGSSGCLVHHFRANSPYDPNLTGAGHQPRGFDEQMRIYDHYTVLGSKITVHFESDVDHLATVGQYCFLMLQDSNSTPANLIDIMEGGHNVQTGIKYRPRSTTSGKSCVLSQTFSPKKFFGLGKDADLVQNLVLTASDNSNPIEDAIFTLGVACQRTTTTDPPAIIARVEIEYVVAFTEKKPMPQSVI